MGSFACPWCFSIRSAKSRTCSNNATCLANVVSHTCANPRTVLQNACTRRSTWRTETGVPDVAESDAAREARLCGAMDSTGILCSGEGGSGFDCRNCSTSACDWRVMSTDSADVMHPLPKASVQGQLESEGAGGPYLQARQSFRLI
jgi:hypothetical protein